MHFRRLLAALVGLIFVGALAVPSCSVVNKPDDPIDPSDDDDGSGGAGLSGGMGGSGGIVIPPNCGDGVVDADEDCDSSGESATCDIDCSTVECGDNLPNTAAGEDCDSGAMDSATCDADCSAVACGDTTLNTVAGETCDDGNTAADDGCSGSCAIEGSCASPVQLTLSGNPQQTAMVTASTGGVGGVDAFACDGNSMGDGSDRIYAFTLTATRSVNITLTADFPALLRVLHAPCDTLQPVVTIPTEDGCAPTDAAGAASETYPSLTAGTYYVIVDGQAAADAGQFTLTVTASQCQPGDVAVPGGCQLTTVCGMLPSDMFCGGNCSANHNQFAHWWCQLGGYSGAATFTVVSSGLVDCLYYNGGLNPLTTCTQVVGPTSYGTSTSCTAVDNLVCIP
jgi:cysteine-rich repeat protein